MQKLTVKQAIVVEGRYDINALRRVCDAMIIETSGFRIFSDREKLTLLRRLAAERGLIILTDSDSGGFVIRNYLRGSLPRDGVSHAYIPQLSGKERRKRAASKEGLIGVEGMEDEIIRQALTRAGAVAAPARTGVQLTKADLYAAGLSGRDYSAKRRALLLKAAELPASMSANALLEAMNLLYSREEFEALIKTLDFEQIS